jgi:hypothetical protein
MLNVYKDGRVFYNEEELKQQYTTKGMVVTIDAKEHYVHKLVAERFLEDYKPFYKVVHINGNVTDNKVENLKIEIPLDSLEVTNPGKRPITLRHKTTGETFKFDSLREASVFMGYSCTYLEKWFYTKGKDELSCFHEYEIVKIAPKDTRIINREGKTIFLRNKTTGEVHYFLSLAKASRFLGKNSQYIKTRLQRGHDNLPEECDYEIIEVRG